MPKAQRPHDKIQKWVSSFHHCGFLFQYNRHTCRQHVRHRNCSHAIAVLPLLLLTCADGNFALGWPVLGEE